MQRRVLTKRGHFPAAGLCVLWCVCVRVCVCVYVLVLVRVRMDVRVEWGDRGWGCVCE